MTRCTACGADVLPGWIHCKVTGTGICYPERLNSREEPADWRTPPEHYAGTGSIQPWDVIREFGLDFWEGNVLKYVLRSRKKGTRLQDLKKARDYLNYLIDREES